MAFERWGYQFDGAYLDPNGLQARAGVYVIWCQPLQGDWTVLDVGESDDVRDRINKHDRSDCWRKNCSGTIQYSATYTPNLNEGQRRDIESRIRSLGRVACGER